MKKYDAEDVRMAHERGEKALYVLAADAKKAIADAFNAGLTSAHNGDIDEEAHDTYKPYYGLDYAKRVMEESK